MKTLESIQKTCKVFQNFETTLKLEDGEMIDMTYTTRPADYEQFLLQPFSAWGK